MGARTLGLSLRPEPAVWKRLPESRRPPAVEIADRVSAASRFGIEALRRKPASKSKCSFTNRWRVKTGVRSPGFFTWRMFGHGIYVMGLEPANCSTIEGRVEAGKRGTLPFLDPGESRTYDLSFELLRDAQQLATIFASLPQPSEQS